MSGTSRGKKRNLIQQVANGDWGQRGRLLFGKGQIALVGIIAVFLLLLFLFVYSHGNRSGFPGSETGASSGLQSLVTDCITSSAQSGSHLIGRQGGYLILNPDQFVMDNVSLGLFSRKGRIIAPSVPELEGDVARFIDINIPICVKSHQSLLGYPISLKSPSSKVQILESKILINTDFPVEARPGSRIERVSQFSVSVPVRLGLLHNLLVEIVKDRQLHPGFLDMDFLSRQAVPIQLRVFNESYLVFTLIDSDSITRIESPFRFNMVMDSPLNHPPRFEVPDQFSLRKGVLFRFTVSAVDPDGDVVAFSSNNPLFSINQDGLIEFTPQYSGKFFISIRAEDSKGAGSEHSAIFEVRE